MESIITLLISFPYITFPHEIGGWLGCLFLLVILMVGVRYWWESGQLDLIRRRWLVLLGLMLVAVFGELFLGIRLPKESALPLPGLPVEPNAVAIMFFSALPWVLGGGILGPLAAVGIGIFSGFVFSLWETHSLFTPLQFALLALVFSVCIRQRYRTFSYRILRHPIIALIIVGLCFLPLTIFTIFLSVTGSLEVRLDYALTQGWLESLALWVELFIAGVIAEIVYLGRGTFWGRQTVPLTPSPSEVSLQLRFINIIIPVVLGVLITLIVCDWIVAGNAARQMVRARLSSMARVTSDSIPFFFETGQKLITSISDASLLKQDVSQLPAEMERRFRIIPFFKQIYLCDASGTLKGGYPQSNISGLKLMKQEDAGVSLALKGVQVQVYTLSPWLGENTAQITFISAIKDEQGKVLGVLIGRTDLLSNPFTQPAINAFESVQVSGGEGVIIDETGQIIYHTRSSLVMTKYIGQIPEGPTDLFFEEASPTGSRRLVFYQPVNGRAWSVLLSYPAEMAQQLALGIAIPLLIMSVLLFVIAYFFLRVGLKWITSSLHTLAWEASLISQGQLDQPLNIQGVDEVGQLGRAFEQMRISLKDRLDEMNQLLTVSKSIAAHWDIEEAVRPVLQAALSGEACLARIVLARDYEIEVGEIGTSAFRVFGLGNSSELYAYLDEQIFEQVRQQDKLLIPNTARMRRLNFSERDVRPGAIIALPLQHETQYYGVLWVAYEQPYVFSEAYVRFLSMLASEAALAAANARLYANTEIGRQRLEAVINSTPEPVLVFDRELCLLLLNPAALQIPGLVASSTQGLHVKEVITHPDLLDLISSSSKDRQVSREITLASSGRMYFVSVASVIAEEQPFGKVCILRDITHYKELDTLKTDFVATVSHDLRSPLTLMRGYATMLQMVGELNDQQQGYVAKIIAGVESMSHLVGNLLDIGRLDAGISLQLQKISPGDVVRVVTKALQPQAAQKNIKFMQNIPTQTLATMEIDTALLQQALYNLVENAIKYTAVGGEVKVNLQTHPGSVVFEVSDTGIGIAPLDLPHMFEKFYRSVRREAYHQHGTGLGLAIVKSIAERHHGRVWVESQLGKGSTFYMEIPYQQPQVKKLNIEN